MKTRLDLKDDVADGGLSVAGLAQKRSINILVDGERKKQLYAVGADGIQFLLKASLLISDCVGRVHAHPAQSPKAPVYRQQTVAALHEHLERHRLASAGLF